ncbi:MAG: hypothetical protein IJS80_04050 [Lachnospiraceae bacterium]|nr:hypothetical protein [Lachnospiraceae bacterium]
MNSILIVEDEENLNRGIKLKPEKEGYQVKQASILRISPLILRPMY